MNFMKDRQGECLGKISHPYRVWKVYKHRFSENTELATGRTLTWLQFCLFFIFLLRKPSKIWCETSKIKNSETGVFGTRKQNWYRGMLSCNSGSVQKKKISSTQHSRPDHSCDTSIDKGLTGILQENLTKSEQLALNI